MEAAQAGSAGIAAYRLKHQFAALAGTPGRYPVLDSLRACAIILVLLRHWAVAAQEQWGSLGTGPLAALAFNGWLGVDLFFVLSGFLIATHFAGPDAGPVGRASISRFYRRRAFRTLPLYWGVILLCWLAARWGIGNGYTPLSFLTHFFFLQDYLSSDVLVTLWSLAVEEKFYLAAPLLLYLLLRLGRSGATLALLLAMALIVGSMQQAAASVPAGNYSAFFWAVRAPFHHAMLAILAGVLIAILHGAVGRRYTSAPGRSFLIAALAALALLGTADWVALGNWQQTCAVIAIATAVCAALVWFGLAINRLRPAFGASPGLRLIAKLSYALYLAHYPLLVPAIRLTEAIAPSPALFFGIYLVLSFAAAWLLHIALEKPFLRLRDRRTTCGP
jgi:peptidoglycan/LPS O-acetylase OafA/YrhL